LALPLTLRAVVEPGFIDAMGHMNVSWYVHLFDRATWSLFAGLGIDEAYRRRANTGMFAVEEQVRYLSELREGDALEVHTRLLRASARSLRMLHVMTDPGRARVSATAEVVGVHIDLATRRTAPFPPELAARIRGAVDPPPGGVAMEEGAAQQFARDWIAAWNRRDLEAVLAPFTEDAMFVSPTAETVLGHGTVRGKAALRRYWQAASARISVLRFSLDSAAWSPADQVLTIRYVSALDDAPPRRAVEILRFEGDAIVAGEAFYGAQAPAL
jgi:acyl-CoA thioester hydrolase